jgi:hypothetical protein
MLLYSCCSATIGSSREVRRADTAHVKVATASRMADTTGAGYGMVGSEAVDLHR